MGGRIVRKMELQKGMLRRFGLNWLSIKAIGGLLWSL
jgi:hypothetical protein